jgi:RNA polymerase sigma-70 factor (ECF subfamily)
VDAPGNRDSADPPDDEFKKALAEQDFRAGVGALMRNHGTAVYRFCLDLLREPDAAQDLLQLVFLQAYEALPRYEPRTTPRAWLFGIARHRCMDALKGQRMRLRVVTAGAELPDSPDPTEGTEKSLLRTELQRALWECLEELPVSARELLHLRFSAQLPYEEIAELSGERPGTLRVRVARAMPLLRQCLERKGMAA